LFGLLAFVLLLLCKKGFIAVISLCASITLFVMTVSHGALPLLQQAAQGAMERYAKIAGKDTIISYEIIRPSLTYFTNHPIEYIKVNEPAKLTSLIQTRGRGNQPVYLVTKTRFLPQLRQDLKTTGAQASMISTDKPYCLLKLTPSGP
jgi:hypothetical protein